MVTEVLGGHLRLNWLRNSAFVEVKMAKIEHRMGGNYRSTPLPFTFMEPHRPLCQLGREARWWLRSSSQLIKDKYSSLAIFIESTLWPFCLYKQSWPLESWSAQQRILSDISSISTQLHSSRNYVKGSLEKWGHCWSIFNSMVTFNHWALNAHFLNRSNLSKCKITKSSLWTISKSSSEKFQINRKLTPQCLENVPLELDIGQ